MSRPEEIAPPEVFYNDDEAAKYTSSSRVQQIQAKMTLRTLELLNVPQGSYILDVGCGSGLSGEVLTEEGHHWVGMDIAPSMLATALDKEVEGDLFLADMGDGVPFRAGTFDAAISISAIQWLCNADTAGANPKARLMKFFSTLYASLRRGGKAVCQFYPANDNQRDQIVQAAKATGFGGGIVVDDPESKKNTKYYLVLSAGMSDNDINLDGVQMDAVERSKTLRKGKKEESAKQWIQRKKEVARKRGKRVAHDSKFTARKRRPKF